MGKLILQMFMFNSYDSHYQRVWCITKPSKYNEFLMTLWKEIPIDILLDLRFVFVYFLIPYTYIHMNLQFMSGNRSEKTSTNLFIHINIDTYKYTHTMWPPQLLVDSEPI